MTSALMSGQLVLSLTSFFRECLLSLVKAKRKFTLQFNIPIQALRKKFGNRFPKMQLISSKSALTRTLIKDQKYQSCSNIHGSKKWYKRSKSVTIYSLKSERILQTSQRPPHSSQELSLSLPTCKLSQLNQKISELCSRNQTLAKTEFQIGRRFKMVWETLWRYSISMKKTGTKW